VLLVFARSVTTRTSATESVPGAEYLLDVSRRDERDVAPHRALECADGRADVHRLLELALLEHGPEESGDVRVARADRIDHLDRRQDRKSTRLNSSHEWISYAVFCLKKKKQTQN